MCALEARVDRSSGELRVHLTGEIDETADLTSVFSQLDADTVFDMGGVRRINSPGILQWTNLISRFAADHDVVIENVSYPMGIQAHCLSNLFGGAEVRSCVAPYFCPRCKLTINLSVTAAQVADHAGAAPPGSCTQCQGALDFDELDSYFGFLTNDTVTPGRRKG